jgi:hypothetical protein
MVFFCPRIETSRGIRSAPVDPNGWKFSPRAQKNGKKKELMYINLGARLVPQLAEENQEGRLRARACVLTRLLGLVSDERAPTLTLNTALEKIRSARAADRLGHVCRLRRQVRSRSQFAAVHYSFYLKTTAYACHGTG